MDTSNRTFVSSVLFLDIVAYSKQSVTDQLVLKRRFNELLVDALKYVAPTDRIVLDTGDGAAVSFQSSPEDSLFAAMRLRDSVAAEIAGAVPLLEVRFGINLGPVRLIKDINGHINIIGDGINVAQRVMSFADPGTILVTRSYYEVVSRLSDDYAKIFKEAGTRTDKHVRKHAVYVVGRRLEGIASDHPDPATSTASASPGAYQANIGADSTASPAALKHSRGILLARGIMAIVAILAVAVIGARVSRDGVAPHTADALPSVAPSRSVVAKPSSTANLAKTRDNKPATGEQTDVAKLAKSSVFLSIKPWGEVYVDGKRKGVSPPLKTLSLTPGTHTIEVRNTTFQPYARTINVKPESKTRLEYKF